MKRVWIVLVLTSALGSFAPVPLAAQDRPPGASYSGSAFNFTRIADDVYIAIGTGNLTVMSNAAIVINEHDVLVVDSHVSPAAAWALLEELRTITPKPVRYVVNSHWHFDHSHGNQIYGPEVEIIGHEVTRQALLEGRSLTGRTERRFLAPIPGQVENLRGQVAAASDAEARAGIERRLAIQENHLAATNSVVPTPPTITLQESITLFRGGREIQIHHLGRGHTAADVVVYLPAERIVMTGDLFYGGLPYMGDGYLTDWVETLERLKQLDFDVVLPGHGQPVRERERIDHLQAYLRDLSSQIAQLHRAGVPVEEAAARVDLRAHSQNYPAIRGLGVDRDAVERAYELLDGGS